MTVSPVSTIGRILSAHRSRSLDELVLQTAQMPSALVGQGGEPTRAVLALALNLILMAELLDRVPTARAYVEDVRSRGGRIVFDHGALRTVDLAGMGDLPAGREAITRVLEPLGYEEAGLYPLDRLKMTGRSYAHKDDPEGLPQFFVSELHVSKFSREFQESARRVTSGSTDPLDDQSQALLAKLSREGSLSFSEAVALLPALVACFQRQHGTPATRDYERLLQESAEMAWIATEGNVFNHATDRVADIDRLALEQRELGRPMKATVEVSRNGRVRQTAFLADPVDRHFTSDDGAIIIRSVPGSFYEFIQRGAFRDAEEGRDRLDLSFDSGNAQGIFKMTAQS